VVEPGIAQIIAEIRNTVTGELTGRSQVVDHLLDLRLAGSDQGLVTATVDRLLTRLPGQSTVSNAWFLAALSEIERAAAGALTH
jgi:hypothetical protein